MKLTLLASLDLCTISSFFCGESFEKPKAPKNKNGLKIKIIEGLRWDSVFYGVSVK